MSEREFTGFALFHQTRKRNDKAPDFRGDGKLDKKTIEYIIEEVRAGRNPTLEIVGWMRQGRKGKFQSISINIPYEERDGRRRDDDGRDDRRDERRDERRRDDRQSDMGYGRRSMSDEAERRRDDRGDRRREDRYRRDEDDDRRRDDDDGWSRDDDSSDRDIPF
jgi:hypothetical protein